MVKTALVRGDWETNYTINNIMFEILRQRRKHFHLDIVNRANDRRETLKEMKRNGVVTTKAWLTHLIRGVPCNG